MSVVSRVLSWCSSIPNSTPSWSLSLDLLFLRYFLFSLLIFLRASFYRFWLTDMRNISGSQRCLQCVARSLTHSVIENVLTFRRGSQVNRFVCSVAADRQENRFTSLVQYFSTPKFTYSAQFVNAFVRLLVNVLFLYSTLFPVKFDMNCNDF